jgi:hypothetical protein
MERACAAVCERCREQGPPEWSTRGALYEPGHPEYDLNDGQWWHRPGGDNEGRCGAHRIRVAFDQPRGCQRAPEVPCDCPLCGHAADKLAKEGPRGRGSCRDCGGYNVRVDQRGEGWRMGCADCGNWAELPAVISLETMQKRHDDLTGKEG